jgi:hypothetical protein
MILTYILATRLRQESIERKTDGLDKQVQRERGRLQIGVNRERQHQIEEFWERDTDRIE